MKTPINPAILGLALAAVGCSSSTDKPIVTENGEPAVTIRESLARSAATLDVDGRKLEVQKIYVQQRLLFAFTPPAPAKPYEMDDGNVLRIGRLEVRLNRVAPGVYRLDGDGSLHAIASGAQAALIAWNDDKAWIAPVPAHFDAESSGALGIGVGGL